MQVSFAMPGLNKVREAVKLTEGQIASRDAIAIGASLDLIKHELGGSIATGPGHFGYHAKDELFTRVSGGTRIVGQLATIAPQLAWLERGTRPHVIKQWHETGRGYAIQIVIHHPGERARHLFQRTLDSTKSAIRGIFVGATQQIAENIARASK